MEKYENAYLFQVYWYPYIISEKTDFEIFLNSSSSCIGLGLSIFFDLIRPQDDRKLNVRWPSDKDFVNCFKRIVDFKTSNDFLPL